jgi:hypothetical protein
MPVTGPTELLLCGNALSVAKNAGRVDTNAVNSLLCVSIIYNQYLVLISRVGKWLAYPAPLGAGGVGSIPANVPSFRRWQFEMKLSPFVFKYQLKRMKNSHATMPD